ncbi:hypothetical protein AVEN_240981-1 [Araneus ventricosus]|uniref:Uncharacterized protein n=1 Tax=Araneus ventricosus TaxID=182803 RepID=A0A4Y2RI47_ARAVE|nr:hypothetical protein AVEN_240981-1 [Araneus ventricosus]
MQEGRRHKEIEERKRQEELKERRRQEEIERRNEEIQERRKRKVKEYEERKRKDKMDFELQKIRLEAEFLKQQEGYFGTDLVILSRGQMTRTTPDLASLLCMLPHYTNLGSLTHGVGFRELPDTHRIFSGMGFRAWNIPAPIPRP